MLSFRSELLTLIFFLISSCAFQPYGKNLEGKFLECSSNRNADEIALEYNLLSLKGQEFNMSKLTEILDNPIDKKNIDDISYYYFGSSTTDNLCLITIPVEDNIVGKSSIMGNMCPAEFYKNSLEEIGQFFYVMVGHQYMLGKGNCFEAAIYKVDK